MALRPNRFLSRPQTRAEQVAARDAAQGQVFAREVDDALRQDELARAVRRYGVLVGAALLALLAAVAAFLWVQNHRAATQDGRSEQLTLALDQLDAGRNDAAARQAGVIASDAASDGITAAARLTQAGVAMTTGHRDQALHLYNVLSADAAAPQPFRDLATIRAVAADNALTPDQVIARLKPLALPGAPWFGSAGELVAMAYLKQGRRDLAAPLFGAIARDPGVPDTLRARSRQMAGLLGFDAVDDVAHAAGANVAANASGPAPQP